MALEPGGHCAYRALFVNKLGTRTMPPSLRYHVAIHKYVTPHERIAHPVIATTQMARGTSACVGVAQPGRCCSVGMRERERDYTVLPANKRLIGRMCQSFPKNGLVMAFLISASAALSNIMSTLSSGITSASPLSSFCARCLSICIFLFAVLITKGSYEVPLVSSFIPCFTCFYLRKIRGTKTDTLLIFSYSRKMRVINRLCTCFYLKKRK